jgi:hypothetical protein
MKSKKGKRQEPLQPLPFTFMHEFLKKRCTLRVLFGWGIYALQIATAAVRGVGADF